MRSIIFDKKEVGDWSVIREFILVEGRFLEKR